MSIPTRDYTRFKNHLSAQERRSLLMAEISLKYQSDANKFGISLSDYLGVEYGSEEESAFKEAILDLLISEDMKIQMNFMLDDIRNQDSEDDPLTPETENKLNEVSKLIQTFTNKSEINLNPAAAKWKFQEIGITDEETLEKIWNDLREFMPFVLGRELDVNNPFYSETLPTTDPQSPSPPA